MSDEQHSQTLLTTAEASRWFDGKFSVSTLNNWRSQGRGPKFMRLGGKVFYSLDELERWKEGNVYSSTSNYRASA